MRKEKLKYIAIGLFVLVCGLTYTLTANTNTNKVTIISNSSTQDSVEESEQKLEDKQQICVYICGYVKNPGVYMVNTDTRVYAIIDLAGGLTEDALPEYLNLADIVTDGQKIVVPSKYDVESGNFLSDNALLDESNTLVNINTATEDLLMTLPGIGEVKAKSIVTYRENNGKFNSIEDVINVEGIKGNVFEKIKELIKI